MGKKCMSYISKWLRLLTLMAIVTGTFVISFAKFLYGDILSSNSLLSQVQVHGFNSAGSGRIESRAGENNLEEGSEYKLKKYSTDAQLLQEANGALIGRRSGTQRIAFLFIVRGDIPHEPLWERFFQNHEEKYSLYVHASPGHVYCNGSLFEGKEIPSKPCPRFSRGVVDAVRRLLARALLDPRYNNAWFVNACESTIPIRSFPFVYDYLMSSTVSFVESFYPVAVYHSWETMPEFNKTDLRKGELWMALRREHARAVVGDTQIYSKFVANCCTRWCTWDEQYVQTLLYLRDADGIAKRTVMYVNWIHPHGGSPKTLPSTASVVKELQSRTRDTDEERHDTAFDNTTSLQDKIIPTLYVYFGGCLACRIHALRAYILYRKLPDLSVPHYPI